MLNNKLPESLVCCPKCGDWRVSLLVNSRAAMTLGCVKCHHTWAAEKDDRLDPGVSAVRGHQSGAYVTK